MIGFAQIALGVGEAVSCTRCSARAESVMHPAEQVAEQIAAVAAGWRGGPGPNLAFVGAEPFAHPALPALITAAVDAGCERIRLRTDGGALALSGNAEGAFRAGVRHIELVLLASDAGTHDALSGRQGLFATAVAGAAAFTAVARDAGQPVAITGYVPVCRHVEPHLPALIAAFARMGAAAVLAEPVDGHEPAASVRAATRQAATAAGIALMGCGFSRFDAAPWHEVDAEVTR